MISACLDAGVEPHWERVEERVQDAFCRLLEHDRRALRRFRGRVEGEVVNYLRRIGRSVVVDRVRLASTRKRGGGWLVVEALPDLATYRDTATGAVGTVTGVPEVDYGGQGGFGDVAFLASEASETLGGRTIYLSWAQAGDGDTRGAVVGKGTLTCSSADSCAISSGVRASSNNCGVTWFTLSSVHCADSKTATSSVNGSR